jgi:hypothetical protein
MTTATIGRMTIVRPIMIARQIMTIIHRPETQKPHPMRTQATAINATNAKRAPVARNAANVLSAANAPQIAGAQIEAHAVITAKTMMTLLLASTLQSCRLRLQYRQVRITAQVKSQPASRVRAGQKQLVMKRFQPQQNNRVEAPRGRFNYNLSAKGEQIA